MFVWGYGIPLFSLFLEVGVLYDSLCCLVEVLSVPLCGNTTKFVYGKE